MDAAIDVVNFLVAFSKQENVKNMMGKKERLNGMFERSFNAGKVKFS